MKKLIGIVMVAFGISTLIASPMLTDVSVVQSGNKRVTISYKLANEPAVVTVDIQTNAVANAVEGWTSIGGENVYPTL